MSAIDEKHHPRVELVYRQKILTVAEIAKAFGVSLSAIETLRKRYDWPMRAELPDPEQATAKRRAPAGTYARLRKRAQAILAQQIAEIESGLDAVEDPNAARSAADRERDARTLASLTRTLEKLREQELADKAARAGAREKGDQDTVDKMREDLEQRLSRIAAAGKET